MAAWLSATACRVPTSFRITPCKTPATERIGPFMAASSIAYNWSRGGRSASASTWAVSRIWPSTSAPLITSGESRRTSTSTLQAAPGSAPSVAITVGPVRQSSAAGNFSESRAIRMNRFFTTRRVESCSPRARRNAVIALTSSPV